MHTPRRSILRGIGVLGAVGLIGSGPARGSQFDNRLGSSQLDSLQVGDLGESLTITASDGAIADQFGFGISVSPDGTTALIGAPFDAFDTGAAYVYDLTQSPPAETKLTASDGDGGDYFGYGVSLSSDATTALVGAHLDDDNGGNAGAIYIYDLTTSPPAETKITASNGSTGDRFGYTVSVSGDGTMALVGAPSAESAYLYDLSGTPPTETIVTASDGAMNDDFGHSVALRSDGATALIGASGDDDDGLSSGSAYLYDFTESPPSETKLTASDAIAYAQFGYTVALSRDGNTGVVGAIYDYDKGAAYVYDFSQSPPAETKLTATDGSQVDVFGEALALTDDGTTVVVGARLDDDAGSASGSAYVYDLTASPPAETKLTASDAAGGDQFGTAVAISGAGEILLIGAPRADTSTGAVYVFEPEPTNPFQDPIVLKNGKTVTPTDPDGDGLFEDMDGNGEVDGVDVGLLTKLENGYRKGTVELSDAQVAGLDFDGDGAFTKFDIVAYIDMYDLRKGPA